MNKDIDELIKIIKGGMEYFMPCYRLDERTCKKIISSLEELKTFRQKSLMLEWIYDNDDFNTWVCPNCKECFCLEAGTVIDNNYNYCPSCGQRLVYIIRRKNNDS